MKNQTLLELSTLDFSFIVEENISQIFSLMDKYKVRVEMIQNSAISFDKGAPPDMKNLILPPSLSLTLL